jgi:AbrB family looped-hinge helix DNA binding protein
MKISERGQITIPKRLRDRFGLSSNVEVELTPTQDGILIHKQTQRDHPIDKLRGILKRPSSTDSYIDQIRSR